MGNDQKVPNPINNAMFNLAAYRRVAPRMQAVTNSMIAPTEQARLDAARQVVPGFTDLQNQAHNSTVTNNENLDLSLLNTVGRQRAQTATEIDQGINPEFYATRGLESNKIAELLNSFNLNRPNIEAERLVNQEASRTGNVGNPQQGTQAVSNALKFGDENMKRQDALGRALSQATSFLGSSKASFDPFGRSTVPGDRGSSSSSSVSGKDISNIGADTLAGGQDFMGQLFGYSNMATGLNANRRDNLDRVNETMSSLPS